MRLPESVKVHWVGEPEDVKKLELLIGKPYVGVDAEWKCGAVNAFKQGADKGPAVIQLSSETDACIVDLIGLAKCQALDQTLTKLFMCSETVIVGFSFQGDLSMLKQYMPQFSFYKQIAKLCDLQSYYKAVFKPDAIGLGSCCKELLGKDICKGERMSNWEMRPLRQGQMHYGSLDAYCMIPALLKVIEKA